jgi:hypothetical protein
MALRAWARSAVLFQFGVFVANGAVGHIVGNVITEGNCGALAIDDCIRVRSASVSGLNIRVARIDTAECTTAATAVSATEDRAAP